MSSSLRVQNLRRHVGYLFELIFLCTFLASQGSMHMAVDSGVMLFMSEFLFAVLKAFFVIKPLLIYFIFSLLLFIVIDHGCNGTSNYGYVYDEDAERFTEANADSKNLTEVAEHLINKAGAYSPVFERNLKHALNSGDYALRAISKGEEIFTDYLAFVGDPDAWKQSVIRYVVCVPVFTSDCCFL